MKTSNKILLGILLISFGYLACAQIALHTKYIRHSSTDAAKYKTFFYKSYTFSNIRKVGLAGLATCEVIFSDSIKLQVEKSSFNYVSFNVNGDSLVISGEHPAERSANYKLNRPTQNIKLYLPAKTAIYAFNSNVKVKGERKNSMALSYHFDLTESNLFTRYNYGADSLERYFDTLSVTARKNSQVILFYNDHIKTLAAKLDHSLVNDYHAKIGRADLITDSSSVLVIAGANMNKISAATIKK